MKPAFPALLAAFLASVGAASAQTLTLGTGGSITSVDPHFFNAAPNNALAHHIFDRLVDRDARARVVPHLATEWRLVDERTWEFRLRPGVTWHDGRPFTGDDVAFSYARAPVVPNSPSGFGTLLRNVTAVEVVEPLLLRIRTSAPTPTLPTDLAGVSIVSRHVGQGATTEDYNSGRAAIGTGPYRFVSHRMGDRTELARNAEWWGAPQPWARVSYRFIANDSSRTAAILAGDVDVIDQVAPTDVARLRRDARVRVSETGSLRLVHLGADYGRAENPPGVTDNTGQPIGRNPFLDPRVRRAMSHAINRDALVERAMDGLGAPAGQWMPAGTYSHDPETRPPAFDPDLARRLLAEAGYPNGFRLTFWAPNDRWPNDARKAQAIAQMWARVGLATTVETLPWTAFAARGARGEFGVSMTSWGSTSGEGLSFLTNILATHDSARRMGAANGRRFSSAELDALVERASATMDDAARERAIVEAVRWAAREAPMVPVVHLQNVWALRRGLEHEPRMDERTLAMGVRPVTN